jgi:hypothetical protein
MLLAAGLALLAAVSAALLIEGRRPGDRQRSRSSEESGHAGRGRLEKSRARSV